MSRPAWAVAARILLLLALAPVAVLAGVGALALVKAWPVLILVPLAAAWWRWRFPTFRVDGLLGSGRLAGLWDFLRVGALDRRGGFPLGTIPPPSRIDAARFLRLAPWRHSRAAVSVFLSAMRGRSLPVSLPEAVHTCVFSPTGGGKSTGFVIPFLLLDDASAVVIDPAGEVYAATHKQRAARGHAVRVLDPFGVTGAESDGLNPIETIQGDNHLMLDHARAVADALVPIPPETHEKHFLQAGKEFIAAVIAYVAWRAARDPEFEADKTLATVASVLADPKRLGNARRELMETDSHRGLLTRMGNALGHYQDKELGSVLTTISIALSFLNTPVVDVVTSASTFDPAELRRRKSTLYVVIPPQFLREKAGLIRAWLVTVLRAVVGEGPSKGETVHFLLDEYASLGRLEVIEDALTQLREYDVRLSFMFQGVSQLKAAFPNEQDEVVLANATSVFMGVTELETAKLVSEQIGKTTVVNPSANAGVNAGAGGARTGAAAGG